jgi:MerR family transcriptional regulator, copper efflux regulator
MRITEAAEQVGTTPRMLRYRESLGLLPPVRGGRTERGHRQFTGNDLEAVATALAIERRFDISPSALAFGLRVLAEPAVRAAVAELGERIGRLSVPPAPMTRALDFEQERALRLLGPGRSPGRSAVRGDGRTPGSPHSRRGRRARLASW